MDKEGSVLKGESNDAEVRVNGQQQEQEMQQVEIQPWELQLQELQGIK